MKQKDFIIIGLGQFGKSLVWTLAAAGANLLVIDPDPEKLELVSEYTTQALCADASDPDVLKQLSVQDFDGALVTISHDFEASVMVTMLLKELGSPYVMARASDDLEGRILQKVGADKVVFPEREIGTRIGNELINGNYFDAIELSDKYSIVDLKVPSIWHGHTIRELNIRQRFGLNILGIKKGADLVINPGADDKIIDSDTLVVLGDIQSLQKLRESLA